MDLRRMHDTLTSFAVSAMLTSAVLSTAPGAFVAAAGGPQPQALVDALSAMRAAGWSGTAALSAPEPVAAPLATNAPKNIAKIAPTSSPLLSPGQLQKLLQLDVQYGNDTPLFKKVTIALGLTTGDQVLTVHEMGYVEDDPKAPKHYFAPLPHGEFLFFRSTAVDASGFRLDKDLNIIAAIVNPDNQPVVAMPIAQAQQMLREELQVWSAAIGPVAVVADK